MPHTSIEKFEEELRNEIREMWGDGRLDRIVQIISKYFARKEFCKKFSVSLNFDLVVHTDGGKKWYLVPLTTIAPGMSPLPAVWQEWSEAQKTGNTPRKKLEALRKRMNKALDFSGVSFGLIPHGKYTGKLRRIR